MNTMAIADQLGWITLTLVTYMLALSGYRRSGPHPLMLPVATGSLLVMAALWVTDTPHSDYLQAMAPLQFWIGPATVAMAA
ncbi:MAG: LrgB family protein [Aquabacterium sp.]|nr:LrgB family protein [Aquabacterium sp.]